MKETRFPQRTGNPARIAGFLRLPLIVVLVLATLAPLPACYHSARAKEHVEKGNGYAAKNQLAEAESEYRQAITIDPKLGDAYDRLGLVELRQDRPTAAATSFSRAVELDPKNLEARLRLGNLLVSAAQYEEGRRQAEAVLDRDGRNSGAHRLIGQADLRQLDYVGAESELRQAIDLAPHDPQAYEDLGLAQLLDAEYGAAEKSFENAVDVKPEDPQTYINLSGFYKTQNALARVEQVLRQGMEKNPKAVALPIALAGFFAEQDRSADAGRVLDQVEKRDSGFADGRTAVAEFYLTNGDAAAALERFRALAEENPAVGATARKVAECYLQLGRWQDAREWIDQHDHDGQQDNNPAFRVLRARGDLGALRLREAAAELQSLLKDSPDAPEVYYYQAQVDLAQEELPAAQQALTQSLVVQPGYLPALLGLGRIRLQQNDGNGALQYASQVIATSFWLAEAHTIAGGAYLLRGDLEQAQRAFELAIGLNPRSPEPEERLGRVLSLRGNAEDAEKSYENSLALAPDYAPALDGLAEIMVKQGKVKQARERIEKQTGSHPKVYQLQVAKAEFCVAQKDWPCAERSYRQTLALNPYYVNGYLALANIYAATKRPQEMIREYEAARTKFPDYLPTYNLLARIYEYVGDWTRAQQVSQATLNIDPNTVWALATLARLDADHGGSLGEALQLAQRAKSIQPDDPAVNDALGWVYFKQGEYGAALPLLEGVAAKNPQGAEFQLHLGMVYLAAGQPTQARDKLQAAISLGLNAEDARVAREALAKAGP
jgi:tetratricopeptide (TPR) repeat protein